MLVCMNADPPKQPVIRRYWMDNWGEFVFNWSHEENDPDYRTVYSAWYRGSKFVLLSSLISLL